jgi:hypothetical protein
VALVQATCVTVLPVQAPAVQVCPLVHLVPQVPQLFASVLVSTQAPPQAVCPAVPQTQAPAVQVWPVPQVLPQVPQFFASVLASVQAPLQAVCPAVLQAQALFVHNNPAPQALPHLPQFWPSVAMFTQLVPHWVSPVAQVEPQAPCEQTCVEVQVVVQLPQCAPSDFVSMHMPLQSVSPSWQTQAPAVQD